MKKTFVVGKSGAVAMESKSIVKVTFYVTNDKDSPDESIGKTNTFF